MKDTVKDILNIPDNLHAILLNEARGKRKKIRELILEILWEYIEK